jgi:hypothetical protein
VLLNGHKVARVCRLDETARKKGVPGKGLGSEA